jgi:hypothetical protein
MIPKLDQRHGVPPLNVEGMKPLVVNQCEMRLIRELEGKSASIPIIRVKKDGNPRIALEAGDRVYVRAAFDLLNVSANGCPVAVRYLMPEGALLVLNWALREEERAWCREASRRFKNWRVPALRAPKWSSPALLSCMRRTETDLVAALTCWADVVAENGGNFKKEYAMRCRRWDADVREFHGGKVELLSAANPTVQAYVVKHVDG